MNVGSMSAHWTVDNTSKLASMNACLYYRIAQPLRELRKHDFDATVGFGHYIHADGHFGIGRSESGGQDRFEPDVVILQGWMSKEAVNIIKRAKACGQIILNDIDDFVWGVPHNHVSKKAIDPKLNPDVNINHYRDILAAGDGIICSTQFLANYLKRLGPPTYVCRNAIDLTQWPPYEQPDEFTVGWIGVQSYRDSDLQPITDVLAPYLVSTGASFRHIGYLQGEELVARKLHIPSSVPVTVVERTTMDNYPPSWEGISLLVVPLASGPFNEAKSWLRGLESAAHAIPFVATDMPEYRELGVGRLAKKKWQWTEHLEALADVASRKAEGIVLRRRAEELSITRQWVQWADVLADYGVKPVPGLAMERTPDTIQIDDPNHTLATVEPWSGTTGVPNVS